MDSDNDSYHSTVYTSFENGCSENSTQKLLTKYYTEENNKHIICLPTIGRSVLGKTVPSVLSTSGTVFLNTDLPASK